MEVERINVYDFMVNLSGQEFRDVKSVADNTNDSIERVLFNIITCGFDVLRNGKSDKEIQNDVEG